ncbi:molybdenum cofactor biosynthesis protein MoaB [Methanobacterium movens]|nr:MAG: molybdenum cofactor biosynthesis protein [Methanobacterium sp.]
MKSRSMEEHRQSSPSNIKCGVITLSDSRYQESLQKKSHDISGEFLVDKLNEKYKVVAYEIIPDDSKILLETLEVMISDFNTRIIITTGGTGIGSRDITVETLQGLFEKELTGFGEIFRYETYKELGAGAILSRATAGIYKRCLIIALPGSPNAVKMGMKIIGNELGHLVKHLKE